LKIVDLSKTFCQDKIRKPSSNPWPLSSELILSAVIRISMWQQRYYFQPVNPLPLLAKRWCISVN